MVVSRPQRGLEAVRVAGFLEQRARLGRVIRPRAQLLRKVDARRHHALGRHGVASKGHLGERVLVDRVVDGLAHLGVVERLDRGVQAQVALDNRRRRDQLDLGAVLQHRGLLERDAEGKVRLAGLHDGRARVVVDHRLPGDAVDLRVAGLPVAGELLALQVIGLLPLDELERAGADRVEGNLLAVLLQRGRRDHHRRRMRQHVDERRERLLQRDLDGGIEGGAVVELDALLQLDGIDQAILADVIAVGQHVDQLHVLVHAEQALVERFAGRLRQRVVRVVRVQRGEGGIHRHHRILGRKGRGGGQHAERAGGKGAGHPSGRNHTCRHRRISLVASLFPGLQ
ncbi:hypothetical protein FQZ97_775250 [compost metagenome]